MSPRTVDPEEKIAALLEALARSRRASEAWKRSAHKFQTLYYDALAGRVPHDVPMEES